MNLVFRMGDTRVRGDDPGKFERKKDDSKKSCIFLNKKKMMEYFLNKTNYNNEFYLKNRTHSNKS